MTKRQKHLGTAFLVLLVPALLALLVLRSPVSGGRKTGTAPASETASEGDATSDAGNGHDARPGRGETEDWCAEHKVPESECTICHPELTARRADTSQASGSASVLFRRNATDCATNDAVLTFESARTLERAGLTIQEAAKVRATARIEAPAEVVFDQTQTLSVSTTVPVSVSRWTVHPGEVVRPGDIIAILQSPDIARLKADLVGAHSQAAARELAFRRKAGLVTDSIVSRGDYEEAKSAWEVAKAGLTQAEGLLSAAGLNRNDLARIVEQGSIDAQFDLRAPAGGTLMQSRISLGELVQPGVSLATISRLDHVWVEAAVSADEARRIHPGARLEFISGGNGVERSVGEVIWVSRSLDPVTRAATVRAKVTSSAGPLSPAEYGRAVIDTGTPANAVIVPKDAVQWEGCCNVVFIQESPERFRPRKVTIDAADGAYYMVTSGLKGGEQVAVNGSYLLKTELRKGSLGTGCCGPEPGA